MATPQEKPLNISETSPLREEDDGFEEYEEGLRSNGCGCFQGLCFRWKRRNNNGGGGNTYLLHHQQHQQQQQVQEQEIRESWLVRQAKRIREISELVAGPKWKTFIRRFSVNINSNNNNNNNNKNKRRRMQFQYDAQSYKLNFDDGICREDQENNKHVDFSARFACPVLGLNRGELL
ncbi:hypothetical protein ACOSP7_008087 [Xanthoceras sorbifolium]